MASLRAIRGWAAGLAAVGLGATIACTAAPDGECAGKCDSGDATGWKQHLEGHNDPIAAFLRGVSIDDRGLAALDFDTVLAGVAAARGCAPSSIRTYIVSDSLISNGSPFPRLISTTCSDDDARASEFFLAASLREEGTDDVDVHSLEMYAWDEQALMYRFYEAEPSDDVVQLTADPARCAECHKAPSDLDGVKMPMTPIMNELTAPWVHWDAEPDFPSHTFEVSAATQKSPHYLQDGLAHLGSASRFEQIIRAAHAKVANARVRERRNRPADLDTSMALLRPLFCAEQVNYATEDFSSGLISTQVAVPGGMRELFLAVRATNWPWNWLNDGKMRLGGGGEPLFMVPVRGNADVEYESRLVAVGGLTAMQALRVRALDWKRPVFSDLRCALWKDARARFAQSPPALDPAWRNSDAMAFLFEEIMKVGGGAALRPAGTDQVIALDLADGGSASELAAAVGDGSIAQASCGGDGAGFCLVTLDQLGAMIDGYVRGLESGAGARADLGRLRDEAICRITETIPAAPALPAVASCQ